MLMKCVAVTGGSGQLGTLLLRRLVNDPNVERVVSIDMRPPFVSSVKLRPLVSDIRDRDLSRHFTNCDAVIHCASLVAGPASAELMYSVNVEGGKNVFRAAVDAGVKTIVHMSSVMAYGCVADHPVPIEEDSRRVHQADFPYASCKFQLEAFLDEFEREHPDVAISRIRANILIGRNIPHFLGKLLHIGWVPDIGGTPLPLVWDEDVADLVIAALHQRARGAFNAAAAELLSADELAERLGVRSVRPLRPLVLAHRAMRAALQKIGVHLLGDPAWVEKTKGAMLVASSRRAVTELGWVPVYPTATAVVMRFQEVAPLAIDFRIEMFLWLSSLLLDRPSGVLPNRPCSINLYLDGRGGRDLTLIVDAGRLRVRGGPQTSPTSTIVLRDALFRELLTGKTDPGQARRDGKISIEGEPADWETFERLVAALAAHQTTTGARSAFMRFMERLCRRSERVPGPSSGRGD